MRKVTALAVTILTCTGVAYSSSYRTSVSLTTDVLDGYDVRHRPVLNQTSAVSVSFTFVLLSIHDFDVVAEKFSVFGMLYLSWKDEIITWDPDKYEGAISTMFRLSDVWYPNLMLTNAHSKLKDLGDDWMTVRTYSSGDTIFVPGAVFETVCSVDARYYPFDSQSCDLVFSVWGYTGTEVTLVAIEKEVVTSYFTENGEWVLLSSNVSRFPGGHFTSDIIKITFRIKRKPIFMVVNVIMPIVLMAFLNFLVFLLPAESGERVSYSVTVLLALAVFMTLVADNLPKKSEPMPVMSFFLVILISQSTLISCTTILNLRLYFKKGKVPGCFVKFTRAVFCFPCRFRTTKTNNKMNKVSPVQNDDTKEITDDSMYVFVKEEPEITWPDVSAAVDMFLMIIFFLSIVTTSIIFLSVLAHLED